MADGVFEELDPKLNMYALANGMDLLKESGGERVLTWYRDGKERGILILAAGSRLSVVAAAWKTKAPTERETEPVDPDVDPAELSRALSARLDPVVEIANRL